jgi:hypothetical protein
VPWITQGTVNKIDEKRKWKNVKAKKKGVTSDD